MERGTVEVGTVGREGMVGLPILLHADSMPTRTFVQVPGAGMRMPALALRAAIRDSRRLERLLYRYAQALFDQVAVTAACNRLHTTEERCARWILMTHDRVRSDTVLLKQEFLAAMLGVQCTAGVGVIPEGRQLSRSLVQPGDKVVLSGTIGEHGMAVMLARGDLAIDADIASDTAPVHELVETLLAAAPSTRWMRDATRGGVGTVANELVKDSPFALILDEDRLPIQPQVLGACDMLGIDPLYVANEGKFVAIVPAAEADAAIAALRQHPQGADAAVVGEIVPQPHGIVALRTSFGGSRIVDMLVGDPLPRIC